MDQAGHAPAISSTAVGQRAMFRGVQNGTVDDKGRLKLPVSVKRMLHSRYAQMDIFVTSLDGQVMKVYPIREWEKVEERLADKGGDPGQGSLKNRILFNANRFGSEEAVDGQGRLLVPAILREQAGMKGAVRIQWQSNHMVVMSEARYNAAAEQQKLTDEDLDLAADLGL